MDATRLSDGETVILRRASCGKYATPREAVALLMSEPAKSHQRNHTADLYEVLDVPGTDKDIVLVMPVLHHLTEPEFEIVGEVLECFRQVFEVTISRFGLLGSLNVIHTDLLGVGILAQLSRCSWVRLCGYLCPRNIVHHPLETWCRRIS